jgi:membrane-bound lytic murein transglycosylase D
MRQNNTFKKYAIGAICMRFIFSWILLMIFIAGCANKQNTIKKETFTDSNLPQDLYLVQGVKKSVDSLYIYYQHALQSLDFKDSIGARIYFDKAFNVISNFDEETKSVLMEWNAYDTLIHQLNSDYIKVNPEYISGLEAEEIREELTDMEEEVFGDLSDSTDTEMVVDSNLNRIPIQMNRRVELALKYFQTKGRKVFQIWMERSGKYEHIINRILQENDLPPDLLYLAMIESGFNPNAYSYARASGLWQFIYATGKHYGLRSNWWFDERRDPILATQAAAEHLKDLYGRFEDWYLALAGYNCNPRKIERRMRQYNTADFWKLKRLPRQTRNYIPTFLAARIIAENPKKYGFYVNKMVPVEYDTITISECVDLNIVAKCVNSTFSEIKAINPAVKRWCTPPGIQNFVLNIPPGTKEVFWENYKNVPDNKKRSWVRHRVRNGETLSEIARKYGTTIGIVKSQNGIRGTLIRAGQHLVIPVPQNKNYYHTYKSYTKSSVRKQPKKVTNVKGHKKVTYLVKKGDTLGGIAEIYKTRASKIRSWNGLYYGQHIYPNQRLTIWIRESFSPASMVKFVEKLPVDGTYHIVRRGDTLWDIARRYDVSVENIKTWNNKRSNKIKPGERLKIKIRSGS